jgi:hypothetical protein
MEEDEAQQEEDNDSPKQEKANSEWQPHDEKEENNMFLEVDRWKDYEVPKNHNLESVSAKNKLFLSPILFLPTHLYPRWAHYTVVKNHVRDTKITTNLNPTRRATPHGRRGPTCHVRHSRSPPFILYLFFIS